MSAVDAACALGHSEDLSAADLLYVFSAFMADQNFVAFRNGMGSYPAALGPRFDSTLGAEVVNVTETDDGVTTVWRDASGAQHEERVAGVVLACDAAASARMHAGLDAESRAFLSGSATSGVRYRSLVHVNLAVGGAGHSGVLCLPRRQASSAAGRNLPGAQ